MARVLTFAERFPAYHLKAGQQTCFPQMILESLVPKTPEERNTIQEYMLPYAAHPIVGVKLHTIRLKTGKPRAHVWKPGDTFSPRVWSGKPYSSKQQTFCPDLEVVKVYDFDKKGGKYYLNGHHLWAHELQIVAQNDGLKLLDLIEWFSPNAEFEAQVICWVDPDYEKTILE